MQMFKERADPGLCSIFGLDDLAAAASAAGSGGGLSQYGIVPGILGSIFSNGAVQSAKNAAERAAQDNTALTAANYSRAQGLEAPFTTTGINANNQINALLGLPSTGITPQSAQTQSNPDYGAYVRNNKDLNAQFQAQNGYARGRTMDDYGRLMWTQFDNSGRNYTPYGASTKGYDPANPQSSLDSFQAPAQAGPDGGAGDTRGAAQNAFQQYLDSTGHQFRLDTGVNALQSSAAAKGLLKSGSTLKGLTQYGQNLGTNDFQNYLQGLQVQQGLGTGASNVLVNVGSTGAGQQAQTNDNLASTTANAALAGAANNNQLLSSITNAMAYASGKSSYGGSSPTVGNTKTYSI